MPDLPVFEVALEKVRVDIMALQSCQILTFPGPIDGESEEEEVALFDITDKLIDNKGK